MNNRDPPQGVELMRVTRFDDEAIECAMSLTYEPALDPASLQPAENRGGTLLHSSPPRTEVEL